MEKTIAVEKAVESAAAADLAADNAVGTILEEETRWAADAARKAADFIKAVNNWVTSKKSSSSSSTSFFFISRGSQDPFRSANSTEEK